MRASLKADIEKLFAIYMEIEGPSAKRPLTSEMGQSPILCKLQNVV